MSRTYSKVGLTAGPLVFRLILCSLLLLLPACLLAVPLPNDACATPGQIPATVGTVVYLSTAEATTAPGDPQICGSDRNPQQSNSVWYEITAPYDTKMVISTANSDYDTVLAVFTGDCDALQPVTCNDDYEPGKPYSCVRWNALAGVRYLIEVAAYENGPGGQLYVNTAPEGPVNDDCSAATTITTIPSWYYQGATYATTGSDDPVACKPMSHTVWYKWTPVDEMSLLVQTYGSDFDTVLAVYTGSCGALTMVNCNDDFGGERSSLLIFQGLPGQTYYIEAGEYGETGSGGKLELNIWENAPANDIRVSAKSITTLPWSGSLSVAEATTSPDDPLQPCSWGGPSQNVDSVWYVYTSDSDRRLQFNTFGSDYDTVLTLYTGTYDALTEIACNDDASGLLQSQVVWQAYTNERYWIEVTRLHGTSLLGNRLVAGMSGVPPVNDDCAYASALPGIEGYVTLDVRDASVSPGEPSPCVTPWYRSVWYQYTPAANGMLYLDISDSSYEPIIQVFTGSCGALSPVACLDTYYGGWFNPQMALQVLAGQKYYIQISARNQGDLYCYLSIDYYLGAPAMTIQHARSLPEGSDVTLTNLHTTMPVSTGTFARAADRSAAIFLLRPSYSPGTTLTVSGRTVWDSQPSGIPGNLMVYVTRALQTGGLETEPGPLGMTGRSLGGSSQGHQPGGVGGVGPCTQGQLVRFSGKVTYVDPAGEFYVVDDGSGILFDGLGVVYGFKVSDPNGSTTCPNLGDYVSVSGCVWLESVFPDTFKTTILQLPAGNN